MMITMTISAKETRPPVCDKDKIDQADDDDDHDDNARKRNEAVALP